MGEIKDVINYELGLKTSIEQNLVVAFIHNFSIGWHRQYTKAGTVVSAYLLKPDKVFYDTGYTEEILLAYSPFQTIEPRFISVCEEIFADPDVNGRVDPYAYFLVSDAANSVEKIDEISSNSPSPRMPVAFSSEELSDNRNDPWFVRQRFIEKIASRDLFDVRLPIHDEWSFFGRKDVLSIIIDSTRRSENIGIFGLRKVGKTSVLYRAIDICGSQNICTVLYIDCKRPDIWGQSWKLLIKTLLVEAGWQAPKVPSETVDPISEFRRYLMTSHRRILIIFDEVEFISPISPIENEWKNGFVPFWQTLWSTQSESKKLSIVIAGVNSVLLEQSKVGKVQNPLFSLIKPIYLSGLKEEDLRSMSRILGRKMGLSIEYDPAMWLYRRYGGHPLLTRIACSVLHSILKARGDTRPITITPSLLDSTSELLDSAVLYYSEHVTSSLQDAFPSEFVLLEALALGRRSDFFDQARNNMVTQHLTNYGLVRRSQDGSYEISIRIVEQYLIQRHSLQSKHAFSKWIVPSNQRSTWVRERKYRILKDFRFLSKLLNSKNINLFGPVILPEADDFTNSPVASSESNFQVFINSCNRTFVESVEQYGKSIGKNDYFWKDLKASAPNLWRALNRIKLYRNDQMHLVLRGHVIAGYTDFIREDIGSTSLSIAGENVFFTLQQGVLDALLHALQIESSRHDN